MKASFERLHRGRIARSARTCRIDAADHGTAQSGARTPRTVNSAEEARDAEDQTREGSQHSAGSETAVVPCGATQAAPRQPSGTPKARQRDWKPDFLNTLKLGGHVLNAAQVAGVTRQTAYKARDSDEDFALAWADAIEEATETLERVAVRRSTVGTKRPVFYRGEVVGSTREMSDTLLIFLLKSRRPEVYRDNAKPQHEHSGTVSRDVVIDVVPPEEVRAEIARLLDETHSYRDAR
jgi:hypothetical protein